MYKIALLVHLIQAEMNEQRGYMTATPNSVTDDSGFQISVQRCCQILPAVLYGYLGGRGRGVTFFKNYVGVFIFVCFLVFSLQ